MTQYHIKQKEGKARDNHLFCQWHVNRVAILYIGISEQHMQRGATVILRNTVKSSFSISDTESLQATNNEQQRNGLGVAWMDLGHGKQHTAYCS